MGKAKYKLEYFHVVAQLMKIRFMLKTKNYAQRLFLGVIPHNKTIFNTILELIEYLHIETQDLLNLPSTSINPFNGDTKPCTQEWNELIDLYTTSLTYFSAIRELSSIKTDLE